jgi:prophage DNA circulation protein
MPAWLDQLQAASFRGVPFQVDTIEHHAGDNVVLREYPFQDLPTVFRMGAAAEEIKFAAYVIGSDYTEQRDRLREVLTGSGVLVHPTVGSLRVYVAGKFTLKENPTAEGGMCRFDLVFVRADERRYPAGVPNSQAQAEQAADQAQAAAVADFAAGFSLAQQPGWVADRVTARLADAINAVAGSLSGVTQNLGSFTDAAVANLQTLRDTLPALVSTPALLAQSVASLFALPLELPDVLARRFAQAFTSLFVIPALINVNDYRVSLPPLPGSTFALYGLGNSAALSLLTPQRVAFNGLNVQVDQLIETLAVSSWVRAISAIEVTSYEEALALRADAHTQITRLLVRASQQAAGVSVSDPPALAYHDALSLLLSTALGDVRARTADLVRLSSFTPDGWMPVWLISYQLYDTTQFADQLLALNPHITHPLLAPPGVAMRVLEAP